MVAVPKLLLKSALVIRRPGVDIDAAVAGGLDQFLRLRAVIAVLEGREGIQPVAQALYIGGQIVAGVGTAVELAH